jgi:hypothetical protein
VKFSWEICKQELCFLQLLDLVDSALKLTGDTACEDRRNLLSSSDVVYNVM